MIFSSISFISLTEKKKCNSAGMMKELHYHIANNDFYDLKKYHNKRNLIKEIHKTSMASRIVESFFLVVLRAPFRLKQNCLNFQHVSMCHIIMCLMTEFDRVGWENIWRKVIAYETS